MSFYEQAGKRSLLNEVDELYILSGDRGDFEIIKSRMGDNKENPVFDDSGVPKSLSQYNVEKTRNLFPQPKGAGI